MTRLLNFTKTQERGFFRLEMKERKGLYSSGEENMNERSFNEG